MSEHDLVLVVDFGAQYAQLIARRVREARVYSEIVPHTMPVAEMLARKPKAIILSGGPSSVYGRARPHSTAALFEAGVPVFGMCYGFQMMAQALGGEVSPTGAREYGRTPVAVVDAGTLLADLPAAHSVWMSHGDSVTAAPAGLHGAGLDRGHAGGGLRGRRPRAGRRPVAPRGAAHRARPARCSSTSCSTSPAAGRPGRWSTSSRSRSRRSATQIGEGRAICALSGGVDSAVAAAIVQRAIGDRLTCVYVDHGMMRLGRDRAGRARLRGRVRLAWTSSTPPTSSSARSRASSTPRRSARSSAASSSASSRPPRSGSSATPPATPQGDRSAFLVQGTLYPDVVESGRRRRHLQHQVPPQRRRPARRPRVRAGRAAAHAVQGRGPPGRRAARPAAVDGVAPAVPRPRARHPDHRRGHPRAPRHPARGRRDRPRGADRAPASTATSGSSRWCCSPTSARSASRATAAPTATPSCCARSPPRTR